MGTMSDSLLEVTKFIYLFFSLVPWALQNMQKWLNKYSTWIIFYKIIIIN